MKYITVFMIAITCITSCEKDVNVKIPYEKDALVLNNLFYADSFMYAQLFISQKLTNNYTGNKPNNATIALLENNVPKGSFTKIQVNGIEWYKSPIVAQAGKEYKLVASAPGYDAVEGLDVVPAKAVGQVTSLQNITSTNSDFNKKLKFQLTDDPITENFYKLSIYICDTNLSPIGPRYKFTNGRYTLPMELEGLSTNAGTPFSFNYDNEVLLTDENFNGRTVSLTVNFDNNANNFTHYQFEIMAISKATYRYLISLKQQSNTTGNPFAEASTVYNNIKNGYGIVGAVNEKHLYVKKN